MLGWCRRICRNLRGFAITLLVLRQSEDHLQQCSWKLQGRRTCRHTHTHSLTHLHKLNVLHTVEISLSCVHLQGFVCFSMPKRFQVLLRSTLAVIGHATLKRLNSETMSQYTKSYSIIRKPRYEKGSMYSPSDYLIRTP